VYFVDAAHFVLSPFFGFLWCFARVFICTPAGRNRVNVLGALNAVNKEVISVINETFVNSDTVRELLDKIQQQQHGMPVTVIMDNAKYQRCNHVTTYAAHLGIEILFLPSYSPNLNLIERLWKFVKKTCLYSVCYDNFGSFKAAIVGCIFNLSTKHNSELQSLLTLNFQTFNNVKLST
jgi:transposase